VNQMKRCISGIMLGLLVVALAGCQDPLIIDPNPLGYRSAFTEADITYPELATRYNETVEGFDSLWARTEIEIQWVDVDANGERDNRFETGDGQYMMRRPHGTALLLEKGGAIMLWAGSNQDQYWLFDVIDRDHKTAYVGSLDRVGQPGSRRFPLAVRPDRVPYLMGLMPLPVDTDLAGMEPTVYLYRDQYMVELPGMRLLIDPATFRPSRVDLTDDDGYSVLICNLSGAFPVRVSGADRSDWPTICETAAFYVSGVESRITLQIVNAETDSDRVRDVQFNFDGLRNALQPQTVEQLDGP